MAIFEFNVLRRTFLTLPPQSLTANRTLPYPSSTVYAIIADVSSYQTFLPYCLSSRVTAWSAPHPETQQSYPSEATLVVGWGNIKETFTSSIYCVPGRVVEAIGGATKTRLRDDEIAHHKKSSRRLTSPGTASVPEKPRDAGDQSILTHLSTRWTLRPFPYKPPVPGEDGTPKDRTEVMLSLEFQFANPVYAALSQAAAPKVAGMMIEAFEKRIREVIEGSDGAGNKGA
ncbi:hypothetical protein K402DRAFT_445866 [Aulographum hederae CBS 113979]|uniref:Coenzyme Q-binding protein COQ10 START domain-containing protein n=1 Tax=Aulographum hederae CBS 113979 TaxID=1176131 RepID=A0A6G1H3Y4_9PEZI|nr:hypothetical protein K402DRAFT_445866 [Aulographum hederae CBS 113979]